MSGATAFLALIFDRAAPLSQIHMVRDRLGSRRSPVNSIPHIMNVAKSAELAPGRLIGDHWSWPKVSARMSFECR
jgi:hypothetical protein